jgi:hypothetical protein
MMDQMSKIITRNSKVSRPNRYIFCTGNGKPLDQSNILRRSLHPVPEKLGVKRCGFHAFRRLRNTFFAELRLLPELTSQFLAGMEWH